MIPFCFHPTRVVMVDFFYELTGGLDINSLKSRMTFNSFQSSHNALYYMNEIEHPYPFPSRYTAMGSNERRKASQISFGTHQEIYRPQRFEEISTVVANYFSPGMTGLELFEKMKNPHI